MRFFAALAVAAGAPDGDRGTGRGQQPCDPFGPAQFAGGVPTPKQVLGFDLGKKDVTTAESDAYLGAVDRASDRVTAGVLGALGAGPPAALRDRRAARSA